MLSSDRCVRGGGSRELATLEATRVVRPPGDELIYPLRAVSGPVMSRSIGNVEAMMLSEASRPALTTT
jgi:hypothetical protein